MSLDEIRNFPVYVLLFIFLYIIFKIYFHNNKNDVLRVGRQLLGKGLCVHSVKHQLHSCLLRPFSLTVFLFPLQLLKTLKSDVERSFFLSFCLSLSDSVSSFRFLLQYVSPSAHQHRKTSSIVYSFIRPLRLFLVSYLRLSLSLSFSLALLAVCIYIHACCARSLIHMLCVCIFPCCYLFYLNRAHPSFFFSRFYHILLYILNNVIVS